MAKQISACYNVSAHIIYAPIRIQDYPISDDHGDYYLSVSRLISHKRVDLAVRACQVLGRKLVVVGDGPERLILESIASDATHFLGRVSDPELKRLYSKCRAVIFTSEEDYGLVPLESQACGRPVIAYGSGGVLETVIEGKTGVFFTQQTTESVIEAILAFEAMQFDTQVIRQSVQRFDVEHFKRELREFVLNP
jgi:glycosyltransferase involved in cell wall biosynthesis